MNDPFEQVRQGLRGDSQNTTAQPQSHVTSQNPSQTQPFRQQTSFSQPPLFQPQSAQPPQPQVQSFSQPQPQLQPQLQNAPLESLSPNLNIVAKVEQVLILTYGAVASLLLFRFVLSLLGAYEGSPFVDIVYGFTEPFMIPFAGMFGATIESGRYSIQFEALVGVIVYALVFFGLARLVRIIFR